MRIIINPEDDAEMPMKLNVPYSIGDIVVVTNYGSRAADQSGVFKRTVLPSKNVPFCCDKHVMKTDYTVCNTIFKDLQWKIIDIGVFKRITGGITIDRILRFPSDYFVVRLRNRNKGEILVCGYDGLELIRKGKKQYNYHVININ